MGAGRCCKSGRADAPTCEQHPMRGQQLEGLHSRLVAPQVVTLILACPALALCTPTTAAAAAAARAGKGEAQARSDAVGHGCPALASAGLAGRLVAAPARRRHVGCCTQQLQMVHRWQVECTAVQSHSLGTPMPKAVSQCGKHNERLTQQHNTQPGCGPQPQPPPVTREGASM